jgi:hypothetical protein
MKCWFLAAALLLGCTATDASADYVILMLNISHVPRGAGVLGGGMAGGNVGMPGGMAGMAGGRPAGALGVAGGPGMAGAQGMVGMPPGGAAFGAGGGARPPGGAAGMVGVPPGGVAGAGGVPPGGAMGGIPPGGGAGAAGVSGMRPGGFAGMAGSPPGGAAGAGGLRPPGMPGGAMGMPGGAMGMPGGAMGMPGGGARGGGFLGNFGGLGGRAFQEVDDNAHFIVAVVEVENAEAGNYVKKLDEGRPILVRHKWGTSYLRAQTALSKTILLKVGGKPLPTVSRRYNEIEYPRAFPAGGTPELAKVLFLARWCLEHGQVGRYTEVMDKLVELDRNLPAAKAYTAVKAALKQPPEKNDAAGAWRAKLMESYKLAEKPGYHYALLHSSQAGSAAELDQVLDTLENTFLGFYYWWALRGIELPVPRERQLAVLTDKTDDLHRFHAILTSGPMVGDGFFARREGLTVLSSRRLDESYDALDKFGQSRFWSNGLDRQAVLAGQKPKGTTDPEIFRDAQLVALLLKAMETEAQRTTVSHNASRQLLYSAGLLPRNVSAPEWFLFGMGSFFETSPQAPWPTIGGPSFYWLPLFRELKAEKTPYDTLRTVVTDGYFRTVPPRGEAGSLVRKAHDEALRKARATSWALTYWLAKEKVDGLRRYCKELGKLPRDLELDESTLLEAFARALNAVDGANKPDPAKLATLAERWFDFMNNETLDSEGLRKQIKEYYKDNQQTIEKMSNPGGPGGGPGFPGGLSPPG